MADSARHTNSRSAWEQHAEILLFSLWADGPGRPAQTYGINVLKVREVSRRPQVTSLPQAAHGMEGMVTVRGQHIGTVLAGVGLRCVCAGHGGEAWRLLQHEADAAHAERRLARERVVAVVSDIEMPEMDGFTLTRRIKSDTRFQGIPVVLHLSLTGGQIRALALAAGADEYVPKSEPLELARTVARLQPGVATGAQV